MKITLERTYKIPKVKMAVKAIFLRRFMDKFQIIGIGALRITTSSTKLMLPMETKKGRGSMQCPDIDLS